MTSAQLTSPTNGDKGRSMRLSAWGMAERSRSWSRYRRTSGWPFVGAELDDDEVPQRRGE